jgi:carbon storage regulator
MLVLSRHRDESIIINGNIKVTIVDIRGDKCRVGISAPKEIPVHREEIQVEIDREAAGLPPIENGRRARYDRFFGAGEGTVR